MKAPMVQHSIKISKSCKDAMIFLKSKNISADKYLREGGEKLVLEMAEKNKFKLKKVKLPF